MSRAYIALGLALTAASFAAVTIRLAQINGIPSPLIAAGRLTLATLILSPLVFHRYRAQLRGLARRDMLWALGAGVWIATHFTLLNFALENTTVLVAQVIVNTGPLWVALLETTFLGARLPWVIYAGLMVTLVGGVFIALASTGAVGTGADVLLAQGDVGRLFVQGGGGDPVLGAILAVGGAIAGAVYLTIGRQVRAKVSLVPYVWMVYAMGGVTGFVFVALTGTPVTGHPAAGYAWLLVIALVPQLIGHSGFNLALGYFPATVVSITTQAVTVSAAGIAFLLFAEVPTLLEVIGSLIIAVGVLIVILSRVRSSAPQKDDTPAQSTPALALRTEQREPAP